MWSECPTGLGLRELRLGEATCIPGAGDSEMQPGKHFVNPVLHDPVCLPWRGVCRRPPPLG